jgi:hypothetical protein
MPRTIFALIIMLLATACGSPDPGNQRVQEGAVPAKPAGQRVAVVAAARPFEGEWPEILVMADGRELGRAVVTAEREAGGWERFEFVSDGRPVNELALRYANDSGERDLWVRSVTVDGVELPIEDAVYLRDGRDSIPGRVKMSWTGELRFSGLAAN